MSGHTPGPWRARRDPNHSCEWEAVIDIADGQLVVAATFGGAGPEGNEENAEANARLIAAAPDMLAALQALSEALPSDEYMRSKGHTPGPGIVMMRAAIAKATGARS